MTGLLLDTHVMVWCVFDPKSLSRYAEREILRAGRVFVPAPALYEAVRAITAKRIRSATSDAVEALPGLIEASGFDLLHPDANDWIEAAGLGWSHGDPFDRLIWAMAHLGKLSLVTADETLLKLESGSTVDAR